MAEFGAQLRQAREHRGISLRQIAGATKISIVALEALERDDFSRLPGGIFSRAFVRAYAVEVGLDPEVTVQQFLQRYGERTAERAAKAPVPVSEDDRRFIERQHRAARVLRIVLIVLGVLIAALVVWRLSVRTSARGTPEATSGRRANPALPVAPAGTPSAPAAAQTAKPGDAVSIDLEALDECWTKVVVDGQPVLNSTLQSGDHQHFDATKEIDLTVGNAGAMKWSVNGKPAKLLGAPGDVREAKITRDTVATFVR